MLRQSQLRVPIKGLKLKRLLTCNSKQMIAYIEPDKAVQPKQEPGRMNRNNNNLNLSHYADMGMEQTSSVAIVRFDQSTIGQNLKNVGTSEPQPQPHPQPQGQSQPQTQMPEQPLPKTNYNQLRRRSNVDPARVQYIKDRFKDVTNNSKTQEKKFVSRAMLHSGRFDKLN